MSKSLIIDAGHGGTDSGATGNGLLEKNINLKMSLYQYKRLKELGASVDITRMTDKNLSSTKRTNMIRNNYDYCISNHFNAFNGKARGVETIHSYLGGKQLASDLASAIVKTSGLPLRRVFSRRLNNGKDYYFMHRLTGRTRTVIIEYGFIDNKSDMTFYKNDDNFYKVAESVVKVLCQYLGVKYKKGKNITSTNNKKVSDDIMFKVQTGAFKDIKNAKKQADKLENDGYNTYIVYDKQDPLPANKRLNVKDLADKIEKTTITGHDNRARYLGLTRDEYEPVRQELNKRYS